MPKLDTAPYPIAATFNRLLRNGPFKVGHNNVATFRRVFTATVAKSVLTIPVAPADCYVVVRLQRASCANSDFSYSVVDEELTYRYVSGVGSYGGASTNYVFSGGAGAIGTRSDTFVAGADRSLTINFTFPAQAYMAGYAHWQIIPTSATLLAYSFPRYSNIINKTVSGFTREAYFNQPYSLYPYRRYIQVTRFSQNNVTIPVTQDVTFDPINGGSSVLFIKMNVTLIDASNHGTGVNQLYHFAVQAGSLNTPPYSVSVRNTTTATTTPPSIYANTIGFTLTPVTETGSSSVVPRLRFTGVVTGLLTTADCIVRMETVCAADDGLNYS